ncbi:MAG: outer membrane protein assembly factor BamE [Rhodanobacter sp.]
MQKLVTLLVLAAVTLSTSGCHLVYTPDVQQGNLLDKTMVGQLKPGMTKRQVLLLMGTPSVSSPFEQGRWDYVSTVSRRGGPMTVRTFTLTFNNDTLVRTTGDFFAQDPEQMIKESKKYKASTPADEGRGDKSANPDDKKGGGSGGNSGSGDGGNR